MFSLCELSPYPGSIGWDIAVIILWDWPNAEIPPELGVFPKENVNNHIGWITCGIQIDDIGRSWFHPLYAPLLLLNGSGMFLLQIVEELRLTLSSEFLGTAPPSVTFIWSTSYVEGNQAANVTLEKMFNAFVWGNIKYPKKYINGLTNERNHITVQKVRFPYLAYSPKF